MSIITNPPGLMNRPPFEDASSKWEQAMQANRLRTAESFAAQQPATTFVGAVQRARTAEAQQQIEDARAEPTVAEREAQRDDEADRRARPLRDVGCDPTPPDTLTLSGARLAAYRQLEAAATAAAEAQQAMTSTGVALRDAIQAMCAVMTGVK